MPTPIPLRVHLALDAGPEDDHATLTWTNVTDDVRVDAGVTITAGRLDEAANVDASSCTLTLDDRAGDYSTSNPLGTYYGRIQRGTPIRVGTIAGEAGFGTAASSGWGTPEHGGAWTLSGTASDWSAASGTGRVALASAGTTRTAVLDDCTGRNVDVTFVASAPVVATGGPFVAGVMLRRLSSNTYMRLAVELGLAGAVGVRITEVYFGSETTLDSATIGSFTYAAGERIAVRCQADGQALRIRAWQESDPEPSTWDAEATDEIVTYTPESGAGFGMFLSRSAGNTNVGSQTVTVDSISVETVEFVGNVVEWPNRWDMSANDAMAPIQASGVLRRLSQGQPAIRSALRRQLDGQQSKAVAYYPLEDESDSATAASAVAWNPPAVATNVSFAADTSLPGGGNAVQLRDVTSMIRGQVRRRHSSTGFAAMLLFKLGSTPTADGTLVQWRASGRVANWRLMVRDVNFRLVGEQADGGTVFDTSTAGIGVYTVNPLEWTAVQLEAVVSGANVEWDLLWHQVGDFSFYGASGSFASTEVPYPLGVAVGGSSQLASASVAHLWLGADTLPFIDAGFREASDGYRGEAAATRVARLADESGIPVLVEDGTSLPLGQQRVATLLENLRAAEAADSGVLAEFGSGFLYRPSGSRQERQVEITLDGLDDLAEPPEPTDDDQRVRNDWTVQRDGGSTARETDDDHIALHGRYEDSDTVNIATDELLPQLACWRVHLGTFEGPRWRSVAIDLRARSSLLPAWRGRSYGPRILVTNVPEQAGGDADLIVEGYTQEISAFDWRVRMNCSPASPWDYGEYAATAPFNDDDDAIYDTAGSELAGSATSSAVSLSVATTLGPLWSTNSADYPQDWNVGGERVTISGVSGATSPQTATVSARSVNGVVKAHAAGADVRLWRPTHRAL